MSLEEALKANTEALRENTKAHERVAGNQEKALGLKSSDNSKDSAKPEGSTRRRGAQTAGNAEASSGKSDEGGKGADTERRPRRRDDGDSHGRGSDEGTGANDAIRKALSDYKDCAGFKGSEEKLEKERTRRMKFARSALDFFNKEAVTDLTERQQEDLVRWFKIDADGFEVDFEKD